PLVQRSLAARKLRVREILWPDAHAEPDENALFSGRSRARHRRHRSVDSRASGTSAMGLVEQIDRIAAAQKDVLEAVAAVRGRFPRLRELTAAVPHHDRIFARPDGDLILNIGVVAVNGLPVGRQSNRIEYARVGQHRSAGREERVRSLTRFGRRVCTAASKATSIDRSAAARPSESDAAESGTDHPQLSQYPARREGQAARRVATRSLRRHAAGWKSGWSRRAPWQH